MFILVLGALVVTDLSQTYSYARRTGIRADERSDRTNAGQLLNPSQWAVGEFHLLWGALAYRAGDPAHLLHSHPRRPGRLRLGDQRDLPTIGKAQSEHGCLGRKGMP